MKEIIKQYRETGDLHHFHILMGESGDIRKELKKLFTNNLSPKDKTSFQFFDYTFSNLLVDDVKKIIAESYIKTLRGTKKIFIIHFDDITSSAQNAFLKCVEEPPQNTFFFFIVADQNKLLPTIISRAISVKVDHFSGQKILQDLLKKDIGERMKYADKLLKSTHQDKTQKNEVKKLIKNIIFELKEMCEKNSVYYNNLKEIQEIYSYIDDPGHSDKLLLEAVFLSLPK